MRKDIAEKVVKSVLASMREKINCSLTRTGYDYQDFGHGKGAGIWWVDNDGKLNTYVSTGTEMHHELDERLDMDKRWRGRIQPGGIVTMLPPISLYARGGYDDIIMALPGALLRGLRKLGGKQFFVDMAKTGLKRIAFKMPANDKKKSGRD